MPERNPSPKARLQTKAPILTSHRDFFSQDRVRFSLDMALLQYQRELWKLTSIGATDAEAALFNRLVGAQEFIQVLLNLAEEPQRSEPAKPIGNLSHG